MVKKQKWLSDVDNVKKLLLFLFVVLGCIIPFPFILKENIGIIGPYLSIFALLIIIVAAMAYYVKTIKGHYGILIITSVIIFMGIPIQAMTFPLQSPARNVMSDMYDIAHAAELKEEYADNDEIGKAIDRTCEVYKEHFGFTEEQAATLYHNMLNTTRMDIDYLVQKTKAKRVLSDKKKELKDQPDLDLSDLKMPNIITGEMKTDIVQYLAEQYHADKESERIRLTDALDYTAAVNIEKYLTQSPENDRYQQMIAYEIHQQREAHAIRMLNNLCFSLFSAVAGLILFSTVNIYLDAVIMLFMEIQFVLQMFMIVKGGGDGANIVSLGGFTLLELVKPLYIIIMAGLLSKRGKKYFLPYPFVLPRLIFGFFMKRKKEKKGPIDDAAMPRGAWNRVYAAFWYTIGTFLLFFACSELGTAFCLLLVGAGMRFINRRWKDIRQDFWQGASHGKTIAKRVFNIIVLAGLAIAVIGCGTFWYRLEHDPSTFVDGHSILAYEANGMPLLPEEGNGEPKELQSLSGTEKIDQIENQLFGYTNGRKTVLSQYNFAERTIIKVCQRFYAFFNAEKDTFVADHSGTQYDQIIKARSVGGWLGFPDRSYEVEIAINESDMVFAQVIHTSGVLMALVLIGLFIFLLYFSYSSVCRIVNSYYRLLGMGIIFLLTIQNLLHIMINLSILPIAGIPLMYISNAGTNQFISLLLTFFLYAIAPNNLDTDDGVDRFADNYLIGYKTNIRSPGISCVFMKIESGKILIGGNIILLILLLWMIIIGSSQAIILFAVGEWIGITIPWLLITAKEYLSKRKRKRKA